MNTEEIDLLHAQRHIISINILEHRFYLTVGIEITDTLPFGSLYEIMIVKHSGNVVHYTYIIVILIVIVLSRYYKIIAILIHLYTVLDTWIHVRDLEFGVYLSSLMFNRSGQLNL